MKMNASAKLKTPKVTGCTAGAGPRSSIAELVEHGEDEEKVGGLGDDLVEGIGRDRPRGLTGQALPPGRGEQEHEPVHGAQRVETRRGDAVTGLVHGCING
jgi:hypothetical protein